MGQAEKHLVIRVGRGGDLVMVTPALRALLTARPRDEVHLLTMREGARVLRGFDERLTRVWDYSRRFPARLWQQRRLTADLRAEGYRSVLCFETRPFYRQWLGDLAPSWHGLETTPPPAHFTDGCLDLVAAATGGPIVRGPLELPVSDDGRARAQALLADHGVDPAARLVGLHATFSGSRNPFADRRGRRHRQWPVAAWAELARLLRDGARARGLPLAVVIDSLPEEHALVAPIAAASDGAVTVLTAPPDFERYKGLLSRLDLLVSPNTGPMHMAAALGTHVVALFSGWSVLDCGPYTPPERQDILTPPPGDERLAAIPPAVVADRVLQRI
jgi:ADP-heptose:LPS heptosyltransferase